VNDFPWPSGAATGIGSYPGDDPSSPLRIIFGEVPELPFLPELPARGPGADLVGRAAALLVEMPVAVQPSGWRFADRPGRDMARAHDYLARDLDALEEVAGDHDGVCKVQVAGPWTLAGGIELVHGDRALADQGAVRDLIASLAEGVAAHLADVAKRLPRATILLQLDEPGLPGVLTGTVPTASGFGRLAPVEAPVVEEGLRIVIEAAARFTAVHCCAPRPPLALLRAAGAGAVAADLRFLTDSDAIGESVEAGVALWPGVIPGTGTTLPKPSASARPVLDLWHRLGFAPADLTRSVVPTPSCGLAGASPSYARAALEHCHQVARVLSEVEP
jgi:hypothetical protein